ncbi:hypothetical protein B1H29_05000 [Streptomyces pactum]|uniref:Uncharacterized protein n=1 Tax=Streptomyces pactum TaxID=68249 RepID=A0A1S6J3P6_9ACTN|nr:hypothetical protein B1H29_05000 [Streptomyces pactum]
MSLTSSVLSRPGAAHGGEVGRRRAAGRRPAGAERGVPRTVARSPRSAPIGAGPRPTPAPSRTVTGDVPPRRAAPTPLERTPV